MEKNKKKISFKEKIKYTHSIEFLILQLYERINYIESQL